MTTIADSPIPLTRADPAPWAHQVMAYHAARKLPGVLLNMGMRTGKTRVVVDLAVNLGWWRTLVFCPKSVVPVWPEEFHQWGRGEGAVFTPNGTDSWRVKVERMEMVNDSPRPLVYVVN